MVGMQFFRPVAVCLSVVAISLMAMACEKNVPLGRMSEDSIQARIRGVRALGLAQSSAVPVAPPFANIDDESDSAVLAYARSLPLDTMSAQSDTATIPGDSSALGILPWMRGMDRVLARAIGMNIQQYGQLVALGGDVENVNRQAASQDVAQVKLRVSPIEGSGNYSFQDLQAGRFIGWVSVSGTTSVYPDLPDGGSYVWIDLRSDVWRTVYVRVSTGERRASNMLVSTKTSSINPESRALIVWPWFCYTCDRKWCCPSSASLTQARVDSIANAVLPD